MTTINTSASFSPSKFLKDIEDLAGTIGAPYSEPATREALDRITNRPGDTLNYRAYLRRQVDTISIATEAGILKPDNPLVRLLTLWSALYDGETEQWVDFDANAGLAKTWVNLKGRRPVDDILHALEVPAAVRAHAPTFHDLGLELVTFVAVDYHGSTINLYFIALGPLSRPQAAQYTNLARCAPPTDQEFQDVHQFLNPQSSPLRCDDRIRDWQDHKSGFLCFGSACVISAKHG